MNYRCRSAGPFCQENHLDYLTWLQGCFLALYVYLRACERELEGLVCSIFTCPLLLWRRHRAPLWIASDLTELCTPLLVDVLAAHACMRAGACAHMHDAQADVLYLHTHANTQLTQYTLLTLGSCDFSNVQMEVMDKKTCRRLQTQHVFMRF